MGRPVLFENDHEVAWLILAYLCSHPDAKDTVDGVEKWWLKGAETGTDARTVQNSLDHLVKLGWLSLTERHGTGAVYGLSKDRREKLWEFFQCSGDRS